MRQDGSQQPYAINLKGMQKGSGEPFYLSPGDVIFVPGNKMKTVDQVLQNVSMLGWFRMIFF
jgi:hypothetical protein